MGSWVAAGRSSATCCGRPRKCGASHEILDPRKDTSTTLLETDHREVEDLFTKAEATDGAAKQQVVTKIASELTLHAEIEEQIVYPAMREAGLGDLVDEAEQEHSKVKQLVAQLEGMDAATDEVDSVLAELKADVQHHVEEEETEGFPKFRDAVDQPELEELATKVEEAKQSRS